MEYKFHSEEPTSYGNEPYDDNVQGQLSSACTSLLSGQGLFFFVQKQKLGLLHCLQQLMKALIRL